MSFFKKSSTQRQLYFIQVAALTVALALSGGDFPPRAAEWIFVEEVTAWCALQLESAPCISGACAAQTGTVAICVSIRELKIDGN